MAEELYAFNQKERDEYVRLRSRVLNDPRGTVYSDDPNRNNSSDTLVVQIPTSGLPPMRRANNSRPRPGRAKCQVFEPRYNTAISDYELIKVVGYLEEVLNVGPTWVEPGYAVVSRERYGSYVYECPCIETTGTSSTGTSSTGTASSGTSSASTGTGSTGTSTGTSNCACYYQWTGDELGLWTVFDSCSIENCQASEHCRYNGMPFPDFPGSFDGEIIQGTCEEFA